MLSLCFFATGGWLFCGSFPSGGFFGFRTTSTFGRRLGEDFFGFLVSYVRRFGSFRTLGVLFAIGDVRTITAIEDFDAVAKIGDVLGGFGF